jgi:MFS family permease
MNLDILNANRGALAILLFLSLVYFLENFDRYLIAVSPIPYIDYASFEYSILAGPAFSVIYTIGGLYITLQFYMNRKLAILNQHSKLNVLAISTAIFSAAFTSTAFAVNFWQQCIIRIVMGISQSIVTPFSTSIISEEFTLAQRGSAFAIFNSGTYIAFSVSLSLGTYLFVVGGWKACYIIFGIAGLFFSFATFFFRLCTDSPNQVHDGSNDGTRYEVVSDNQMRTESKSVVSNAAIDQCCDYVTDESALEPSHVASSFSYGSQGSSYSMMSVVKMLLVDWGSKPGIACMCCATGIRLGGIFTL